MSMSRFTRTLVVSPLADGKTWILLQEFGYDIGEEGSGDPVNVPVRFMTDFASVPRPLWWVLPRWGRYGNAAVIHDFCYWDQTRSRFEADQIFLEAMGVLGVAWLTRHVMYIAVRLGGWWGWWRTARLKKSGKLTKMAHRDPEKSVQVPSDLVAPRSSEESA